MNKVFQLNRCVQLQMHTGSGLFAVFWPESMSGVFTGQFVSETKSWDILHALWIVYLRMLLLRYLHAYHQDSTRCVYEKSSSGFTELWVKGMLKRGQPFLTSFVNYSSKPSAMFHLVNNDADVTYKNLNKLPSQSLCWEHLAAMMRAQKHCECQVYF